MDSPIGSRVLDALSAHGLGDFHSLPDGLSGTKLFGAQDGDGEHVVVKILTSRITVVDGHDEGTFRRKPQQLLLLARRFPRISELHVPIREVEGPGWSAHVMPYIAGLDLLSPAADARELIASLLDRLATDGWAHSTIRPVLPYLRSIHTERIRRRWAYLSAAVPAPVLVGNEPIEINGRPCRPLAALLAKADQLFPRFEPERLAPPVHGDLNTRNVIVTRGGFRLIDPRGTLDPLDPCYDVGKLLLSLSIWDRFVTTPAGFVVRHGWSRSFNVSIPSVPDHDRLLRDLPALVVDAPVLDRVLGRRWPARLALTHAAHAVAEAACRVSDARVKGQRPERAAHHAGAFLLFGLAMLDDAIERAAEPDNFDLDAHLALASRFTREDLF